MSALRRTSIILLLWGGTLHAQKTLDQRLEQNLQGKLHATTLSDTARLEWARHLSSNTASSIDLATDVKMDASGCVYVTGKSESQDNGRDYLTIKYSAIGQELWRARYDGPAHADDVPSALEVDGNGNAYVTGMSIEYVNQNPAYQYATAKYNSQGQQEWVARYLDPRNEAGAATAIAVDEAGNVFVTGESHRWDTTQTGRYWNVGFVTIRYGSNGVQHWATRYDGPLPATDEASCIAIDDSGNVFVAGKTEYQYYPPRAATVVVKYNPAGEQRWAAAITIDSSYAEPIGIATDHAGAVYVAGHAGVLNWMQRTPKIFTVKYNAQGGRDWLRFSDQTATTSLRANSLTVDDSGNAVVVGVGGQDVWFRNQGNIVVMMKYNSGGDVLWSNTYREPGSPSPLIRVAGHGVDDAGNICIAASVGQGANAPDPLDAHTILALNCDANGSMQWVQRYNGLENSNNLATAIAVSRSGHAVVAGGSGPKNQSDFVAIKFEPLGRREWDARGTGEGSSFEVVSDMAMDGAGNVYLTGSSLNAYARYDYFTAKYNPQGDQVWKASYNGPANQHDRSNAIVLDRLGNVYVTGSSEGVGTSKDWATIKYNFLGAEQWVARYNGPSNQKDEGHLVAVDTALNVYVAGAAASGSRLTTIKYDPSGHQQWTASYDSTGFVAVPGGLCLDRNGNVYVTNPAWYWADAIAFKYNSLGNEMWRLPGGNDLLVDDSANVYISSAYLGGWTWKYDSSGVLRWHVNAGGTQIEFDHVGDIIYHNTGTIPGWSGKISRGGIPRWERGDSPADWGFGFCVDAAGNSYVSGYTHSEIPPGHYSAKVGPTGLRLWLAKYLPENSILTTQACRVDASGNVYVAGTSQRDDFSNAATILKYAQITVSVAEDNLELPDSYTLEQNYPNPFNPSTTIRFALPRSGHVELTIYNMLGQEVATLMNEEKNAGTCTVQWDAGGVSSGVYFYRLKTGEYKETKKLLLMK